MDYQEPIQEPIENIEEVEGKDFVTGKPLPFLGDDFVPDPQMVAKSIKNTATSMFAMIFFVLVTLFSGYLLFMNLYVVRSVEMGDWYSKVGAYFSAVTRYSEASKRAVNLNSTLPTLGVEIEAGRNTFVKYIESGEKYFGSQSALEHIEDHMSLDGLTDSRLLAVVERANACKETQELIDGIKKKYLNGDFAAFCAEIDQTKQAHPEYSGFMFEISKLEMAAQTKQPDEKQLELFEELYETSPEKINLYIRYGVRTMVRMGKLEQAIDLCKGENADDGAITEMRLYICRMSKDYNKASGIYSAYRYKNSFVTNVDREALITYLLKNNKSSMLEMLKRYTLLEKLNDVDVKLLYALEIAAMECNNIDYFNNIVDYLKKNGIPQSASVQAFANKTLTKEAIFLDFNGEFN